MSVAENDSDPADIALFQDAVCATITVRAAVIAGQQISQSDFVQAEQMLRSIAHSDDRASEESNERDGDETLRRLEAKIDLMSRLLAQIVAAQTPLPAMHTLTISRRGVRIESDHSRSASVLENDQGIIKWQLSDWLPEFIVLPVSVIKRTETSVWLAFSELPTPLDHAIERYVFRLHRRMRRSQTVEE